MTCNTNDSYLKQTIELIKKFEGLSLKVYECSAGKKTIGYGHVILPNENYTEITECEAENLLMQDLEKFNTTLNDLLKVELNDNQKASILSLMFNIGIGAFKKSTLLGLLNIGAKQEQIENEWMRWVYVKKKFNKGLYNRRIKEFKVYTNEK